jgi:glutamate synthase (NADPH) small chain
MADVKGFIKYQRKDFDKQPVERRLQHWKEFTEPMEEGELRNQGARCMDCGVPFCQSGCPIANIIPDWNELVHRDQWKEAIERLHKTNNFPEFTGRVCPAPCENSCVLGINEPPVTIKNIEVSIIERAYQENWIQPQIPRRRTDKKVAVIGSGPAGLACADQLNKMGHHVTVYEKNEVLGGLLTLGIPEFKMEKWVVERRLKRMAEEGVKFKTGVHVGVSLSVEDVKNKFDAVVLCGGAECPRDLPVPGRELGGVHFAMEFLAQQNRVCLGQKIDPREKISAQGKRVVVLGGGDTGSDCIGTSNRQGAISVLNFELMPRPPKERAMDNPWPNWALIERKSSSHEEGVEWEYSVMTKMLKGEGGVIRSLVAARLEFGDKDPVSGRRAMKEISGSEFEVPCDLLLLALGFLGPVKNGLLENFGVELDSRGNVKTDENRMTNIEGVFAAGDMRRGQSLVVWAIDEGRRAAETVDAWLVKKILASR